MARQPIGTTRLAQRTASAKTNANFIELYNLNTVVSVTANNANTTISVPAGYVIDSIAFANTNANAVTGGVKIGTTSGGTDVVAAQAVGANALGVVTPANVLLRLFSRTVATTLYIQPVTAWAGAVVDFRVVLRKLY